MSVRAPLRQRFVGVDFVFPGVDVNTGVGLGFWSVVDVQAFTVESATWVQRTIRLDTGSGLGVGGRCCINVAVLVVSPVGC